MRMIRLPILIAALAVVASAGQAREDRYSFEDIYYECLDYVAGHAPLPFQSAEFKNIYGEIVSGDNIVTQEGEITVYLRDKNESPGCSFFTPQLIWSELTSSASIMSSPAIDGMARRIFKELAHRFEYMTHDFGENAEAIQFCEGRYFSVTVHNWDLNPGMSIHIGAGSEDKRVEMVLRQECRVQKTESKG